MHHRRFDGLDELCNKGLLFRSGVEWKAETTLHHRGQAGKTLPSDPVVRQEVEDVFKDTRPALPGTG
jgi:hypothetical protein